MFTKPKKFLFAFLILCSFSQIFTNQKENKNEYEEYLNYLSSSWKSPYYVLEVPSYSSAKEIKEAYQEKTRHLHPDKIQNSKKKEEFTQKYIEVVEAYNQLKKSGDIHSEKPELKGMITEKFVYSLGICATLVLIYLLIIFVRWFFEKFLWFLTILIFVANLAHTFQHVFPNYLIEGVVILIFSILIKKILKK